MMLPYNFNIILIFKNHHLSEKVGNFSRAFRTRRSAAEFRRRSSGSVSVSSHFLRNSLRTRSLLCERNFFEPFLARTWRSSREEFPTARLYCFILHQCHRERTLGEAECASNREAAPFAGRGRRSRSVPSERLDYKAL